MLVRKQEVMLVIYIILYLLSVSLYYFNYNLLASVVMVSLAIFLYVAEYKRSGRMINTRGIFALGFIGGFGISLLKLSRLSEKYSAMMIITVFIAYFSVYLGNYYLKKTIKFDNGLYKEEYIIKPKKLFNQDIMMILLFFITFISFLIEVKILNFIPFFTVDTPHAYSTFHVFLLHYITSFYSFIPCFAICNYFIEPERKINKMFIILSYAYVIIMSILMISRSRLILSIVLSAFIVFVYKQKELRKIFTRKKNLILVALSMLLFLVLYLIITISRAHDITYLNGIFEMKNERLPIFISQPYMYIAQNFENLNYMINNVFRFTFGRRSLQPLFTLTLIKKFFPFVLDAPVYVIKEELSTLTIVYDAYYDFGLVGVAILCFLIGYIGKIIEDDTYNLLNNNNTIKNNYLVIVFSLYCYYMLFSFFQTYFSLTDTWVYIIILFLLSKFVVIERSKNIND